MGTPARAGRHLRAGSARRAGVDCAQGKGMKILVVDDHPLVRDAMSQLVAGLDGDMAVLQAPDCVQALEIARSESDIDLVLLDLNLPGLRGIPALERFRQEHPATPVVIVSMFRDRETVN